MWRNIINYSCFCVSLKGKLCRANYGKENISIQGREYKFTNFIYPLLWNVNLCVSNTTTTTNLISICFAAPSVKRFRLLKIFSLEHARVRLAQQQHQKQQQQHTCLYVYRTCFLFIMLQSVSP